MDRHVECSQAKRVAQGDGASRAWLASILAPGILTLSNRSYEQPRREAQRRSGPRGGPQRYETSVCTLLTESLTYIEPREYRGNNERGRGSRGDRGGRGFGRGGRGGSDDRQSHSNIGEHEKQAAKGWGAETGDAELNDEQAGEAIAAAEIKEDAGFTPDTSGGDAAFSNGPAAAPAEVEEAAPAEPEEVTKSYDEYLAELTQKRLALSGEKLETRKANEGSKQKFPEGKAFERNPENETFIAASGGKKQREKENKSKDLVVLEGQYYAPIENDRGGRGGRGGGRGGRGRGDGSRGDRGGDRGGRGRGEFRGGFRGDRGDRDSAPRGGSRGGARGGINATDESAFPSLGGK